MSTSLKSPHQEKNPGMFEQAFKDIDHIDELRFRSQTEKHGLWRRSGDCHEVE
jgi:hypothetical protein